MAVELKDVLGVIGFTGDEKDLDVEKLRTHITTNYVPKESAHEMPDVVSKVAGRYFDKMKTVIKQESGLKESEVKDKDIEEIIKLGFTKPKTEIEALKLQIGKGNDEKVVSLTSELDKFKKANEDYALMIDKTSKEFEDYKSNTAKEIKTGKINYILTDTLSKIPFVDNVSDVTKKGYTATIAEKYDFDMDESGALIVLKKDGHKIESKKGQAGKFASVQEILELEADLAKILKKNNAEVKKTFTLPTGNREQNGTKKTNRLPVQTSL